MKFDVATFHAILGVVNAFGALLAGRLFVAFPRVRSLRVWAIGFALMCLSVLVYLASAAWHMTLLLIPAAMLNLQYRLMAWSGVRMLLGKGSALRGICATTVAFGLAYGVVFALDAPLVWRALVLAAFFVPARFLTVREACSGNLRDLSIGRVLIAVAGSVLTVNAAVPLVMAGLGEGAASMLIGNPANTPTWYFIVFASDLMMITGLIVFALQRVMAESFSGAFLEQQTTPPRAHKIKRRRQAGLPALDTSLTAPPPKAHGADNRPSHTE